MTSNEKNFKYCHQIMKEHSKSFSYAFDYLPENERKAVWAIYAVCRIIDDSIDVHENPQILKNIHDDIITIEKNHDVENYEFKSNQIIMEALYTVSQNFTIEYQSFYNLIQTVYEDQDFEMFETDDELLNYCYGVAGTVGEVLTPVLAEQPNEETYRIARKLGEALQITNILRDVGEDFENDRIYFSKSSLSRFDVSIENNFNNGVSQQYIDLWEHHAKLAQEDYDIALSNLGVFNKEAQPIIELASIIYRGILDEVRKASYTLHRRVYVSKLDKVKMYKTIKKKYHL